MKDELLNHYAHTWRVFAGLTADFDQDAWVHTGRGTITPTCLALHILTGVKYYIEDRFAFHFLPDGNTDSDRETLKEEDLPAQKDILAAIKELEKKTNR